ncbi:DMT family transporter [Pedobacter duraquae]|uniref:Drug/metabolite transporter (DMT)-like permease n=1 Tax=Pedobacter duraquae TaxID=425511 RepID=A0A4R6IL00_9SPHI|nr:EamA family transporter [Pedobacter duraquae]TDO22743.1 drug/metabolite transporter (DMT)-like permease [Pedobacter duraquae]
MTAKKPDIRLILALLGVAIIWGTTYLGIRVAVQTIPPWFVTTMRQTLASVILLIYLLKNKELKWIGWSHFGRQVILSMLMIVIANGLTTVAEKNISSGLASLLSSLSPLLVFVGGLVFGTQKPSLKGIIGVVLGLLGVIFIFRDGLQDFLIPAYKHGILIMFVAVCGWSAGTIYIKKHTHKSPNIFLDLFYQFAFSAVVQFILAMIFSGDTSPSTWRLSSLGAVVYLGVFGSVLAFFCYHYALKRVTAVQASVLNYVNTIIAILLGWLILDEVVTIDTFIAAFLIIAGVFMTNYNRAAVK